MTVSAYISNFHPAPVPTDSESEDRMSEADEGELSNASDSNELEI